MLAFYLPAFTETLIKEGILARPRKYSGTQEFKQIIHLARRSSDVTTVSGKSRMYVKLLVYLFIV